MMKGGFFYSSRYAVFSFHFSVNFSIASSSFNCSLAAHQLSPFTAHTNTHTHAHVTTTVFLSRTFAYLLTVAASLFGPNFFFYITYTCGTKAGTLFLLALLEGAARTRGKESTTQETYGFLSRF